MVQFFSGCEMTRMLPTTKNSQPPLHVSATPSRATQQANVAQAEPQENWRFYTEITPQSFEMISPISN